MHEAARIAALADGSQILASVGTTEGSGRSFAVSGARVARLKGISKPIEVVTIDWWAGNPLER